MKTWLLLCLGVVIYALVPVGNERLTGALFTRQEAAGSVLPLLIAECVAFLPAFVLAVLHPALPRRAVVGSVIVSSVAYLAGDTFSLFHIRRGGAGDLWPIEVVLMTGLAAVALGAGTYAGRRFARRRKSAPPR